MENNEKKVRIAVAGIGKMGQYHVNVISQISNAVLTGIYDIDVEKCKEVAAKFSTKTFRTFDELLQNSDAVVVAAPTHLHYELSLKALEAGKHVLVEKPVTEFIDQAQKLVAKAEEKSLILQVGHVERFNGAVQELKNVVSEPKLIEVRRLAPFNGRINDVGVVLDLMIHDLDIVINLVNSPIKKLEASGVSVFSEYEDIANALLEFENGTIATISASRATQEKIRTLAVSQKESYVFLNYTTQDVEIHRQSHSATNINKPKEGINYSQESSIEHMFVHRDNPLKLENSHFIDCILGATEPLVPVRNDVYTLEVTQKILKKIHDKQE